MPMVMAIPAQLPTQSIRQRYLLCSNIVVHRGADGRIYIDSLWHKDLQAHLEYIDHLTLAAPVRPLDTPDGVIALPANVSLRLIELPAPVDLRSAILSLAVTAARLWRSIGESEIVHIGVAGWPIPLGWLAAPMARLRRKPIVLVIESAPWRATATARPSLRARAKAIVFERLARWCAATADLTVYTQPAYAKTFPSGAGRGYVLPATWIDQSDVLCAREAESSWRDKRHESRQSGLAVAYCGRLHRDKGLEHLLAAMGLLDSRGVPIRLDIFGEGEMFDECRAASARVRGRAQVHMLGTVSYGTALFERLRTYHAVVVPSLSDEQPRIVYDAYSQAVPVLASDTPGLRACVSDNSTGRIAPATDGAGWADLLSWAAEHIDDLQQMGLTALGIARVMTHASMHQRRKELLLAMMAGRLDNR